MATEADIRKIIVFGEPVWKPSSLRDDYILYVAEFQPPLTPPLICGVADSNRFYVTVHVKVRCVSPCLLNAF